MDAKDMFEDFKAFLEKDKPSKQTPDKKARDDDDDLLENFLKNQANE